MDEKKERIEPTLGRQTDETTVSVDQDYLTTSSYKKLKSKKSFFKTFFANRNYFEKFILANVPVLCGILLVQYVALDLGFLNELLGYYLLLTGPVTIITLLIYILLTPLMFLLMLPIAFIAKIFQKK